MNRIHRTVAVAFGSLIGLDAAADTVAAAGDPREIEVLSYSLGNSQVADDPSTEDVAFYYNRIAFQYAASGDGSQASDAADYVVWRRNLGTGG